MRTWAALVLALATLAGPSALAAEPLDVAAAAFLAQDYPAAEREALLCMRRHSATRVEAGLLRARCLAGMNRWQDCLEQLSATARTMGDRAPKPWAGLLRAEALERLGSAEQAAPAWAQALSLTAGSPLAPLALFKAAEAAAGRGDRGLAEALYKECQRLDNSFTQVHGRLATLYLEQGRFSDAKTRLERARRADPRDPALREALNELVREQPALERRDKADRKRSLETRLSKPNLEALPLGVVGGPQIRVGLLTHSEGFKFKAGPALEVFKASEEPGRGCGFAVLPTGSAWELKRKRKVWQLRRLDPGPGLRRLSLREALRLDPLQDGGTLRLFEVSFGSGYFFAGEEDRSYRGSLELMPGPQGVTVVNVLPLEHWLAGVLPAEIPATWPLEALRSQAVVARSDGLSKRGRHRRDGFDLCPEVHCAAYRGAGGEHARTTAAVTATTGLVLTDPRGKVMGTVYMNSCGGHTCSPEEAWQQGPQEGGGAPDLVTPTAKFPLGPAALLRYLDEPPMAWCQAASGMPLSNHRWVLRYGAEELSALAGRRLGLGRLRAVEPVLRAASGHVRCLKLLGQEKPAEVWGDAIRSNVKGLKSNLFYVVSRRGPEGELTELLFVGGGWGHGAGFCQQGAAGRARAGQSAGLILKAYFPSSLVHQEY